MLRCIAKLYYEVLVRVPVLTALHTCKIQNTRVITRNMYSVRTNPTTAPHRDTTIIRPGVAFTAGNRSNNSVTMLRRYKCPACAVRADTLDEQKNQNQTYSGCHIISHDIYTNIKIYTRTGVHAKQAVRTEMYPHHNGCHIRSIVRVLVRHLRTVRARQQSQSNTQRTPTMLKTAEYRIPCESTQPLQHRPSCYHTRSDQPDVLRPPSGDKGETRGTRHRP